MYHFFDSESKSASASPSPSTSHNNNTTYTSQTNKNMSQGQEANAATVRGGKFVALGIFLFACLGLALLYPYNAIISASDWFGYVMPNEVNIAGRLSNANFIASLVRKTHQLNRKNTILYRLLF
jgi:hypothetical protein